MRKEPGGASRDASKKDGRAARRTRIESGVFPRVTTTKRALELVAVRGAEVIGVRHLLAGARAWIGTQTDALAPVPVDAFGGAPIAIGESTSDAFLVQVPPNARARFHGADGLGRLLVGPDRVQLGDGDKMVVVLGPVQVRAQVVSVETMSRSPKPSSGAFGWIALVGALYVAALAMCAWISPSAPSHLSRGVQHAAESVKTQLATHHDAR